MSGTSGDPKRAWVKRVLGIEVPAESGLDDEQLRQQLNERIRDIIAQLNNVAPAAKAQLIEAAKAARALIQGPDLLASEIAVEALEDAYATAVRSARMTEVTAATRDAVTYRKLRNDWQAAQAKALAELRGLAEAVVNDPEEDEEEIEEEVIQAAAHIDEVMPRFGTELEELLGEAELEPDDQLRDNLREAAAAKIEAYIGELAGADVLEAVQAFADEEYGGFAPLHTLRETLGALATQLRKKPTV